MATSRAIATSTPTPTRSFVVARASTPTRSFVVARASSSDDDDARVTRRALGAKSLTMTMMMMTTPSGVDARVSSMSHIHIRRSRRYDNRVYHGGRRIIKKKNVWK